MRVLHVLHHSLPTLSGYSIRSDSIIRAQQQLGIQTAALTAPQHWLDDRRSFREQESLSGVDFWRTRAQETSSAPVIREWQLVRAFQSRIAEVIRAFKPSIVHAHSPVLVGLPALRASREAGLPFVYEIRDLWENASVDLGKFSTHSPLYHVARAAETRVLRGADAVVTICATLRRELAPRVESPAKIFVVDNGVDAAAWNPDLSSADFKRRWKLDGKQVIAYAGAFKPYEGLHVLIDAMPAILLPCPDAHLLIAGSGEQDSALRSQVGRLGLEQAITFTGSLPHAEIPYVYASADLLVYPRTLTRTTALTTPLKPLEAMAMGKAALASDIPPMRELIEHDKTGLLFREGDSQDLARQCVFALANPAIRARLGQAAQEWVKRNRQWSTLAVRYNEIYTSLLQEPEKRRRAS